MSVFQTIVQNDTWKIIVMALTVCAEKIKIATDDFNSADRKGRLVLLAQAFSKAIAMASGEKQGNYTCFNADHDDKHPSMTFDKERGHFHCFGCMATGKNYDLFNAIGDYFRLEGFKACYSKAIDLFVEEPEKVVAPEEERPFPLSMYKVMHNPHYTTISNSYEGLDFLNRRGISNTTAIKNGLMVWEYQGCIYLVFINDNGSIVRRLVKETKESSFYSFVPNKWWNSRGEGGFFCNERALKKVAPKGEPIFVVESAMDCLTIQECGFQAIGLNSCQRMGKLFREFPYKRYIILMDNDLEGKLSATNAERFGYFTVKYGKDKEWDFISDYKDINDSIVANKEETINDLKAIYNQAKKYYNMEVAV